MIACCLSLDSYIKPQQRFSISLRRLVVYLLIPTSNHNSELDICKWLLVVYLLIPTSNHNWWWTSPFRFGLFISWFLHQTTTLNWIPLSLTCCLSLDSYIKPQLGTVASHALMFISWFLHQTTTIHGHRLAPDWLFISWFLHQTTTSTPQVFNVQSCLSLDSYIKPQLISRTSVRRLVVYLLIPTSNHNQSAKENCLMPL